MELDHIFIFTKQPAEAATALMQFGLTEGNANVHAGQGTACRRFFFLNAYIELVYVIDEKETKNPAIHKMKLWERSQYPLTNYCPFGLCFRNSTHGSDTPVLIFEDAWRYYSKLLPAGQFANIAANENFPAEPLVFEMPFFGKAPEAYPSGKQQPLIHARGYRKITKLTLILPVAIDNLSLAMKKILQDSIVSVLPGEKYTVIIEFDNGINREAQNFQPLIPLIMNW